MTTKLEAMVDHLAGREGDPGILDELADPSSEASRFLEATRARSKALLEAPEFRETAIRPRPVQGVSRLTIALLALVILLVLGFAGWLADVRFRRLEDSLARSETASSNMARKLDQALGRLPEPGPPPASPSPTEAAISRVEAEFKGLERKLEALDLKMDPTKVDPAIGRIRDDLATLRRDISSDEKARTRQAEEFLTSTHEVARLLRLLLNRTQPPGSTETPQAPGIPPNRPSPPGDSRRNSP